MTPSGIKSVRKRLGLSREQFGERLGFTDKDRRITVWHWETGRRKPSPQTVILIRQILKTN